MEKSSLGSEWDIAHCFKEDVGGVLGEIRRVLKEIWKGVREDWKSVGRVGVGKGAGRVLEGRGCCQDDGISFKMLLGVRIRERN